MAVAREMDVDHVVVLYLKQPPDRENLTQLVSVLEDPVGDLVRQDKRFREMQLDPRDFVDNSNAVIDLLCQEIALMQRPVIATAHRAIIGRPRDRVAGFLGT